MKDENGEVIDETLIPNAFNKCFVELGGKLANKIPRSNILPDSFLSDDVVCLDNRSILYFLFAYCIGFLPFCRQTRPQLCWLF
jgi:hypothetical protein